MHEPRSIRVPDSPYGRRKAKKHAASEAIRCGRRLYLQFLDEGTFASLTYGHLAEMNTPFFTYYPNAIEKG